jgi:hypothetical protein
MGARRRLAGGFRCWLPDHRARDGVVYRRYLNAAGEIVGPTRSERIRLAIERYARAGVSAERAAETWAAIVAKREQGKGRRPSAQAEERAARRKGLEDSSLAAAQAALEALAGAQRRLSGPRSPSELLAAVRAREAQS